jgi:hypothetical protein
VDQRWREMGMHDAVIHMQHTPHLAGVGRKGKRGEGHRQAHAGLAVGEHM